MGKGLSWKKIAKNPIVNVATGGLSGAAAKYSEGDFKGAAMEQVTGGLISAVPEGISAAGKGLKGIGTMSGTQVNSADPGAYQAASDGLLNPVADQFSQFGNSSAITSNVDPAFRDYQLGLAAQLQAQASGQGPSVAQMQLQQATDRSLNQSLGAIRSATGANAGLSARSAALAGAQGLGSAANASGQLRLQEQQQAQQQLAGVAGAGRSGDLTANAQGIQAQQATQANRLAGLQGLAGIRQNQLGTAQNIYAAQNGAQIQTSQNQNGRTNAIIGGIGNAVGTGISAYTGGLAATAPVAASTQEMNGNQGVTTQPASVRYDAFGNPIA
jgi:hypothetical protein